ncbi:hypothetical protein RB593_002513 [Gaeumannomyces tritici]
MHGPSPCPNSFFGVSAVGQGKLARRGFRFFDNLLQPKKKKRPPTTHARILTSFLSRPTETRPTDRQSGGKKHTIRQNVHQQAGRAVLRQEEDGHRRRPVRQGPGPDQGQRPPAVPRRARHAAVYEPLLVIGLDQVSGVDIRVRVTGGGHTSQVYAVRQAIAKSIVAYYQKYVDEHSKNLLKQALTQYDRTLLVADNRRCEPKKFGGPGARSRFQKSYR